MAEDTRHPRLRVVTKSKRGKRVVTRKPQLELFLENAPSVLGLFLLTPPTMRTFAKALDTTRPRCVFDFRILPTFEGAGVNRRTVFRVMESFGCSYVDAIGLMGGPERWNAAMHSGAFVDAVRTVCGSKPSGPLFFLFQTGHELASSYSVLPKALTPAPRGGWSVHVVSHHGQGEPFFQLLEESSRTDHIQPWELGEVLYVVASPSETTGWLLDERGRPKDPVNLRRGSSVRVEAFQVGQWTDVVVLTGTYRGNKIRLASNAHVARLVR